MELFKTDGHLTDEGLQAILAEELNELQSLEASEHLAFCDDCLARYTTLLTDDVLLTPAQPLKKPVMHRIRQKSMRAAFARYATVAAAAALALALWGVGLPKLGEARQAHQAEAATAQDVSPGGGGAAADAGQPKEPTASTSLTQSISDALGSLLTPKSGGRAPAMPVAPEPSVKLPAAGDEDLAARKERESVFAKPQPDDNSGQQDEPQNN